MPRSLVVKTTCGADDAERCNQALTVAAAAVAGGAEVSLWLTGEAVWLAVPARDVDLGLEHATPLRELVDVVRGAGTITVCTQCAARRGVVEADLADGVRIAGAAVFAEEALREGAQALVY